MRILTWNIGSFIFSPWLNAFKKVSIPNIYFQSHLNAELVSKSIKQINPDILIFQEFCHKEQVDDIPALSEYPHRDFISEWTHESQTLIASKTHFTVEKYHRHSIIKFNDLNLLPVHLQPRSSRSRLKVFRELGIISFALENLVVLGDCNIWLRGRLFLFYLDTVSYKEITKYLADITVNILSTSYFGFGLDKVFCSRNLKIGEVKSPKLRGQFMDHYPVYFDIEK